MRQKKENIICFENYRHQLQNKEKAEHYDCFVTEDRLAGFCELLICEKGKQSGQWFYLKFTPEGLIQQRYLSKGVEIREWLERNENSKITYMQALGLLGDSVRQNYKYKTNTGWIHAHTSIHLQRIWDGEIYNHKNNSLKWALFQQDELTVLKTYLCAISNKDAVLLYDLTAEQAKDEELPRELYAYKWAHVLDGLVIFDFEIVDKIIQKEREDFTFFLTVYGEYNSYKVLSIDICLRIVREQGCLRIRKETILEARCIYRNHGS